MTRHDGWYDVSKDGARVRILIVHGRTLHAHPIHPNLGVSLSLAFHTGPSFPGMYIGEPPPDPDGWTWTRLDP